MNKMPTHIHPSITTKCSRRYNFVSLNTRSALSLSIIIVLTMLSACQSLDSVLDHRVDYRSGSDNLNRNPLELPPDLMQTSSLKRDRYPITGTNYYSEQMALKEDGLTKQVNTVLPDMGNYATLIQEGNERWLRVNAPVEKIWPQIHEFWLAQGFTLEIDNPTVGVMETNWLENRAKIPQDWFNKILSKVKLDHFISTGEMDKYRTRLERGPNHTTEIFLSHRGMIEAFRKTGATTGAATNTEHADTIWTVRAPDRGLESEMLSLILQKLGTRKEVAQSIVAHPEIKMIDVRLAEINGEKILVIQDTFERTWRRVGLVLDRSGYLIIDRNRSIGTYYVSRAAEEVAKEEKPGMLASLAFWRSKKPKETPKAIDTDQLVEFEIKLTNKGEKTLLQLLPRRANSQAIDITVILNHLLLELK